ncbi:solute carrier family 22 member 23-like protein [Labeo rohita]|uniref:Solute carrier family 22 member 23-like protein n=1 Tax=Labeo rohita TaxID=84645 RepID=A0A498N269_LABRO|nr:solute carrier family 22 member 23-like protein [Labeo rohita]RXN28429.1 solute carrier family 22 member 23-like protein [Labeo rohita]
MAVSQLDIEPHPPENGFVTPETNKSPDVLSQIDGRVLPSVGGFGRFQKQLIVLTWIPAIFIGFSQFSDSFLLAEPQQCAQVQPNNSQHSPNATTPAFSGVNNGSNATNASSQCMCMPSGCELEIGLKENVVTKFNLVGDSAWVVHIAKFSLLVGSIFGYLVLGFLADWLGRHPVLILSVIFMLIFGMTVAFSVNAPMFSTLRFFEGFCLAGITLSLYALRIELCLPGWRFSMTMVANFVVLAGQLLMPGLAVLCRDWQILQVVVICPLVLILSYIWIFPESLRWLLATQQYSRSKWIMERVAKKNDINLEEDADIMTAEGYGTLNTNFSKAFSIIGMFSSHAVSNLSIFFCAEITPTVIRGGGLGLVLASAGFGMLTAPIMELHNQKGYFLHHIIFACCTLICIICILLLPETRNRPLPETLADGESYTRQPLLPPRKPGEQRSLLTKSESREYARVGDTPLHEAAATAVSTMDSTASSAIDLQMLMDAPVQQATGQVQQFSMKTLTSTQEQSASVPETSASSVEDPLLASIPNTSTPIAVNYVQTPKTESPSVLPTSPLIAESPTSSDLHTSSLLDIGTPLVEFPSPVANDINILTEVGSTGPSPTFPLCTANLSDSSAGPSPTPPLNEIPPSSSIDSPVLPSSPTELSLPVNQVNAIPAQSFSSPIDSGTPLLHLVAQPVINSIESGPPSPAVLEPTLSNGTTLLATVGSTAPHATTTDSVTASTHPLMTNLTVSSPIDSGTPTDVDLPITEANTANGATSS